MCIFMQDPYFDLKGEEKKGHYINGSKLPSIESFEE